MGTDRPCQRAPDMWFATDRTLLGTAVHMCLHHCPRLEECESTEDRPVDGVLAGVLYTNDREVDKKQPAEVRCGGCISVDPNRFHLARPAPREGCGDMAGWRRHNKRKERPCQPCAVAYNRRRAEDRARRRVA